VLLWRLRGSEPRPAELMAMHPGAQLKP